MFQENGVIERKIENNTVDRKPEGIQYWRLTWNPQKREGDRLSYEVQQWKKDSMGTRV